MGMQNSSQSVPADQVDLGARIRREERVSINREIRHLITDAEIRDLVAGAEIRHLVTSSEIRHSASI